MSICDRNLSSINHLEIEIDTIKLICYTKSFSNGNNLIIFNNILMRINIFLGTKVVKGPKYNINFTLSISYYYFK